MECPNCGAYNDDKNQTCDLCGQALPVAVNKPAEPRQKSAATAAASSQVPSAYQPVPATLVSLTRGPFAGYGKRQSYGGWTVEGEGERVRQLFATIQNRFKERYGRTAGTFIKAYSGRGAMNARHYLVFRHGQVTVALTVTPSGHDIFVSSASFLKTPFSGLKIGLIVIGFFIVLCMFIAFPIWASDWAHSIDQSGLSQLMSQTSNVINMAVGLCLALPLGLISLAGLFMAFGQALFAWAGQMDFGAPFRMEANEFQQDDVLVTNRAVEQILHASLDELGIPRDSFIRIFPNIVNGSLS